MNSPKDPIAILFFSRSSKAESESKYRHFAKGHLLSRILIQRSRAVLDATGLPVFQYDEKDQIGQSFGERLSNAVLDLFEKGYEKLIVVGNDAPGLQQTNWNLVISALSSGHAILGPDRRNGAYLIGFSRNQFDKRSFEDLPWQQDSLYSKLSEYFTDSVELAILSDINSEVDLLRAAKDYGFLKAAIYTENPGSNEKQDQFIGHQHRHLENILRGPPTESLSPLAIH